MNTIVIKLGMQLFRDEYFTEHIEDGIQSLRSDVAEDFDFILPQISVELPEFGQQPNEYRFLYGGEMIDHCLVHLDRMMIPITQLNLKDWSESLDSIPGTDPVTDSACLWIPEEKVPFDHEHVALYPVEVMINHLFALVYNNIDKIIDANTSAGPLVGD